MLVGSVAAEVWYLRRSRPLSRSGRWPAHRTVLFTSGLLAALLVTCAPVQHAAYGSFTVFVAQTLALLLVLPIPLIAGQPVSLAAESGSRLARLADTGLGRALYSPVVGAGIIPLASAALLFGPVPGYSIHVPPLGWLIQVVTLVLGAAITLPLIGAETTLGSLAVAAAAAIGLVELLLDAVPGIVMRLSTHPVTNFFDYRAVRGHQWPWLRDQQVAGAVLWTVAELLDLPFLLLIFRKWVVADAREAATADAAQDTLEASESFVERPWFLDDPSLRDRFR